MPLEEELSPLELELWELLSCGAMRLKDLRKLNPKYVGALGKLKSKHLVEVVRLPNRERFIRPITE